MSRRGCDYYKPRKQDVENCPNCHNWLWDVAKCEIAYKVARNDKTDIVHEEVMPYQRGRHKVTGVLR